MQRWLVNPAWRRATSHNNARRGVATLVPAEKADTDARRIYRTHVVRAALREISYFPDPFVQARLRDLLLRDSRDTSHQLIGRDSIRDMPRSRRYALKELVRATSGEKSGLDRILSHAYARTGRFRRGVLGALQKLPPATSQTTLGDSLLSAPLMALIKSQVRAAPPTAERRGLKILSVPPEENVLNIWLQPKSQSTLMRLAIKERAHLLARIHVPLPTSEWEYLSAVALGRRPPPFPSKRRRRVDGASYMDLREEIGLEGVQETVTPRTIRRRYQLLFSQCPHMKYDEQDQRWEVEWGHKILQEAAQYGAVLKEFETFPPPSSKMAEPTAKRSAMPDPASSDASETT